MRNLLCGIGMALLACGGAALAQEASTENDEFVVYKTHCAKCHGDNLEGGQAQSLVDGVWMHGTGRGHWMRNIAFGILQQGMPAYEGTLTDQEIQALARYIGRMEKAANIERPPIPKQIRTYDYNINIDRFVEGLQIPWAIEFLDGLTALITERDGRLRIVRAGVLDPAPIEGVPEVLAEGQGGMLDVAIDPDYPNNGWIYLSYSHVLPSEERRPPAMTRIVRGKLNGNAWVDQQVLFEAPHDTYLPTRQHYGCRIVFDPKGFLYFSIGDRGRSRMAQDLGRPNGKIHRIHRDGRIPADNPFLREEGALPSIFSYGHRNPQGLAADPVTGSVWITEHGPMGGDELNLLQPGLNYGWPEITYGRNYNGSRVTELEKMEGMTQPVLFWRPSIAVCGLDFYQADRFGKWQNWLLAGGLAFEELRLLVIEDDRMIHQEVILKNVGRVRDVTTGPDGAVYVVLNTPGTVIRMTPEEQGF